jgi:hypothetical protein
MTHMRIYTIIEFFTFYEEFIQIYFILSQKTPTFAKI